MDYKKFLFLTIITSMITFTPISLLAATATTTFAVTATIDPTCNLSASSLNFGIYNPTLGTTLDATTTITVTCTNNTPYTVGLNAGTGTGATVSNRLMTRTTSGGQTIAYTLYQDTSHTTVWGNTTGVDTVAGTGSGSGQPLTVYGRIFASNSVNLPTVNYSDTITATVTY